jgi:hypothetical protein
MQANALSYKAHNARCVAAARKMNKMICSSKQIVWELPSQSLAYLVRRLRHRRSHDLPCHGMA